MLVVCSHCGVRAEGDATGPNDYDLAVPGHPFSRPCPRRDRPTFASVTTIISRDLSFLAGRPHTVGHEPVEPARWAGDRRPHGQAPVADRDHMPR